MKRLFTPLLLSIVVLCLTGFTASEQLGASNLFNLKENTKYRIYRKIDLKGETLQIPNGCTLAFRGGTISNGTIVFHSTRIKGHPRFKDCRYKGDIKIKKIDDRSFTSPDDKGTFAFLFSNAVTNGIKCDFNRDYSFSMEGVNDLGIMTFEGITSGAVISFHGCSLFNTYAFPSRSIKPVITFRNIKNITIRDCSFYDVEEHNTHILKASNGCTFIQCYGDCEGINLINCYQENGDCMLRSGVYKHNPNAPGNTPSLGLSNSTLIIRSKNTGYGLALYCGDNLTINIDVSSPVRGFYCAGVSNSKINYYGHEHPLETNCHILLKDAVYKKMHNGDYSLDMKGCSNLNINAVIDDLRQGERVVVFSSYGSGRMENADFRFRLEPCLHSNIDITADIKQYSDVGNYYIVWISSESGAINREDIYGNRVKDIRVHDIYGIGGKANRYLCMVQPYTETQIEFVNCSASDPDLGYNLEVSGDARGRIVIRNGDVDNIYIRDKTSGEFRFDVENTRVKGGLVYIEDRTAKDRGLVRINKMD